MSQEFSATELATAPRLRLAPAAATSDFTRGLVGQESFEGPTIVQDVAMLAGLYRDLLALALWRRISRRYPAEAYELNSPPYG
jgi:hypothetical protein